MNQFLEKLTLENISTQIFSGLFCLTLGLLFLPRIVDILFFLIPRHIMLHRKGYFRRTGIGHGLFEIFGCLCVAGVCYGTAYMFDPRMFRQFLYSDSAIAAWIIVVIHLIYRFIRYRKDMRETFYRESFLKYISPDALNRYNHELSDIEISTAEEVRDILARGPIYPIKITCERRLSYLDLIAKSYAEKEITNLNLFD